MNDTRRFAVKPEAARARLDALAAAEGWTLMQDQTRTHLGLTQRQWKWGAGHVAWIEDHTLGTRTLKTTGDDPPQEKLLAAVPCYAREELERSAACPAPGDEIIEALRCLRSLVGIDYDNLQPTTLTVFAPWCRHANIEVRRAVHHLALCLASPELLPLVDDLAQSDTELGARWKHLAGRIREHFSVE